MGVNYNPKIVSDGLVLHLDAANPKSYPGSGTTWYDLSGNDHNTILVNGVQYDNSYMSFDGTNDYSYIQSLNYGGGKTISELTVDVWFKTSFVSGSNTSDGSLSTNNWAFLDFDRSDVFNFYIEGGGQIKFGGRSSNSGGFSTYYDVGVGTNYILNDGNWHNGCVTFSVANQQIKFYVDGILSKSLNANGSMTALGAGVRRYGFVGDGSEANTENATRNNIYYEGDIASVKFYDSKCLTDLEIQKNFNALRGRYGI